MRDAGDWRQALQLMRDHQRPNGVIGGPAAGIANDMGVAFVDKRDQLSH
jgi:hypothetical protein